MVTSNPKIDGSTTSVISILDALNTNAKHPTSYTVHGTIPLPSWFGFSYHFQGIAPYNGTGTVANGCISGSSTKGYFAGFSQASGQDPQVRSVTYPDSNYFHAAAIQMLGDLLPVPMESENDGQNGKVMCYNVGNLSSPTYLYTVNMPEKKASAVAITTYTDANGVEQALMAVYEYDPRYMRFFQAPAASIGNSANPWVQIAYYQGSALNGDQFQCFGMVTQHNPGAADQVYLLGFREDEELHLFTVSTGSQNFGNLVEVKNYTGWSGSDWRNGVGLQVPTTTSMRIFGTDKDPSGSDNNYTFKIYVWG